MLTGRSACVMRYSSSRNSRRVRLTGSPADRHRRARPGPGRCRPATRTRGPGLTAAPDQGTQPGEQHDERERLREEVVGAQVQRVGLVVLAVLGRQHQDRRPVLPRPAACAPRRSPTSRAAAGRAGSRRTTPSAASSRARCPSGATSTAKPSRTSPAQTTSASACSSSTTSSRTGPHHRSAGAQRSAPATAVQALSHVLSGPFAHDGCHAVPHRTPSPLGRPLRRRGGRRRRRDPARRRRRLGPPDLPARSAQQLLTDLLEVRAARAVRHRRRDRAPRAARAADRRRRRVGRPVLAEPRDRLAHAAGLARRPGEAAGRAGRRARRERRRPQRHQRVAVLLPRQPGHPDHRPRRRRAVGRRTRSRGSCRRRPQAAAQAIAAITPTTKVSVDDTARVAGRPVYQLVLEPKDTRSLIGKVTIAVDSETSVPLRVQVYAPWRVEPRRSRPGSPTSRSRRRRPASSTSSRPPARRSPPRPRVRCSAASSRPVTAAVRIRKPNTLMPADTTPTVRTSPAAPAADDRQGLDHGGGHRRRAPPSAAAGPRRRCPP